MGQRENMTFTLIVGQAEQNQAWVTWEGPCPRGLLKRWAEPHRKILHGTDKNGHCKGVASEHKANFREMLKALGQGGRGISEKPMKNSTRERASIWAWATEITSSRLQSYWARPDCFHSKWSEPIWTYSNYPTKIKMLQNLKTRHLNRLCLN